MRVKFVGDAQIKQAIEHLKNDKLEIYVLFDAVKDNNKFEAENTAKNIIHSIEAQTNDYKTVIYHKSGQFDVSLKGHLKENIVKNIRKTTPLIPTDNIRGVLQLADSKQLATALTGLNFTDEHFLYLDICRVKSALTPVSDTVMFESFYDHLSPQNKLDIVAEFIDKADINLKLLDNNDLEPHKRTADIYDKLGQQTYIDKVKALNGHLPLLGPNQYIYIDMQEWMSNTVIDRNNDIDIFLNEFKPSLEDIDNPNDKLSNKFPLKPDHFQSNGVIQFSWDNVRSLFGDHQFRFSEFTHNCYFYNRVVTGDYQVAETIYNAGNGDFRAGYNDGNAVRRFNSRRMDYANYRAGYNLGLKNKGYNDGRSNNRYPNFRNLNNQGKNTYKQGYEKGIYYKGNHDTNNNVARINNENKTAYKQGQLRKYYSDIDDTVKTWNQANLKHDEDSHFYYYQDDHNQDTFSAALKKLYKATKSTGESYRSSGAYLPLHYIDIYDFINRKRKYSGTNIKVETEVQYDIILNGLTTDSALGKLHEKVANANGTVADIIGAEPQKSGFAEYLWFLVFVNAETSRHAEWNYLSRMSLAAVKNGLRTFEDIFKKEKHLNYVPKNRGAVRTMQRYKNQGLQHEVGLTVLLEREIEKKKKVLKEDIFGVLAKADEDFIKRLDKYITYAKDIFHQSVKDWLLLKLEQFNEVEKLKNKDNAAQLTKVTTEYENAKTAITNHTIPFTIKNNKITVSGLIKSGNEIYTTTQLKDKFVLPNFLKKLNLSLPEEKDIKDLKDKLALSEKDKTIKYYRDTLVMQEKITTQLKDLKLAEEQKTLTAKKTTLEKERSSIFTELAHLLEKMQGIDAKLAQNKNYLTSSLAISKKLSSDLSGINTTHKTLLEEKDKIKNDPNKKTELQEIDRAISLVNAKLVQNQKDTTENEIAKATLQAELTKLEQQAQELKNAHLSVTNNYVEKKKQVATTEKLLSIVNKIIGKPFTDWDALMTDTKKQLLAGTQHKALEKYDTKFLEKLKLVIKELEHKLSDDNIKKEIKNSFLEFLSNHAAVLGADIENKKTKIKKKKREKSLSRREKEELERLIDAASETKFKNFAIAGLLETELNNIVVNNRIPDFTSLNFSINYRTVNGKTIARKVTRRGFNLITEYKDKANRGEVTFQAIYEATLKPQVDKWADALTEANAKETLLKAELVKKDKKIEVYITTLPQQKALIKSVKDSFTKITEAQINRKGLDKDTMLTSNLFKSWAGILTFHLLYHYYYGCYDLQADFKEKMRTGTHTNINKTFDSTIVEGEKDKILKWAKSKYGMLATLEHIPIMPETGAP